MPAQVGQAVNGSSGDRLASVDLVATVRALLIESGYATVEPAIVQDASPFLDLGGEDIRARLYFTSDRAGRELCLRPEFTIPVCLAYLASGRAGQPARYTCAGPVFRFRPGEADEFTQIGLESLGFEAVAAADAEVLALSLEAAATAKLRGATTTFGDMGLLAALLDALRLPTTWQRRLRRGLVKGERPDAILAHAPSRAAENSGVLSALSNTDAAGARALVDDLLSIAGITSVAGRSASEIAERFLEQVALRAAPPFGSEQHAVLNDFLAIQGEPDRSAVALRRLAETASLDLGRELDLFEERNSFMAVQGVGLASVLFSGSFVRNLDYYTGFVFEVHGRIRETGPIVTGGRYDNLAQALGSARAVPAVGAAIWVERLTAQGNAQA